MEGILKISRQVTGRKKKQIKLNLKEEENDGNRHVLFYGGLFV